MCTSDGNLSSIRCPQISVEALLPAPDASPKVAGRATADQCYVIVNGRVVSYRKVEKVHSSIKSSFQTFREVIACPLD